MLFADTFNRAYERENLEASARAGRGRLSRPHAETGDLDGAAVLRAHVFLAGLIGQAWRGADRLVATPCAACRPRRADHRAGAELPPDAPRRIAVAAGPTAMSPGGAISGARAAVRGISGARSRRAGRLQLLLRAWLPARPLVHGHCHCPRPGAFKPGRYRCLPRSRPCRRSHRVQLLRNGRRVRLWRRYLSRLRSKMAELFRCRRRCAAPTAPTLIVADGTSCRHQIKDAAVARSSSMSLACWR